MIDRHPIRILLRPLDFFLLFSSSSTAVAPPGQVDYVGANAFLNAFAHADRKRARHNTVAVNWGLWSDVGMAADSASHRAESPADPLPPAHFFMRVLKGQADAAAPGIARRKRGPVSAPLHAVHPTKEQIAVGPSFQLEVAVA